MKITCNWVKTSKGNGIKEGDTLRITAPNAHHISGGIYQHGKPILAIFGNGSKASIKVARKGHSIKGICILKIRAYDNTYHGSGIDDTFTVI